MKKLVIFFFLSIPSFLICQSGWQKQSTNTLQDLIDIYFINNNTGWVVGDSAIILNTTNGGENWTKSTYTIGRLMSVYFKNQNTGLIGGTINGNLNSFVIKTTNGGNTWSQQNFRGVPYDMFSFGGDTIWSSRHTGCVMKSTNMGNTWDSVFVRSQLELYSVMFIDNNTGWTAGAVFSTGFAFIYKTTNGGNNWFNQFIHDANHFTSIYFINSLTGFTSTLNGYVYTTTNGGDSWYSLLSQYNDILFDICFPSINTGYTIGDSRVILKTNNNGQNWGEQILPPGISASTDFYGSNFLNTNTGWVVGTRGTILKTTNGGEPIGIIPIGSIIPGNYRLSQNYPNPFNPSTSIEFDIPKTSYTTLIIYDINGQISEVLVNEQLSPGQYKVTFNNINLSSGFYYYRLTSDNFSDTKKMVLLK